VDLRLANKRVVESLIKCGAFDSLGTGRAQLMAIVDRAMEAGAAAQRERILGQGSLLEVMDLGGGAPLQDPALPAVAEWSRQQRLAAEKETLGFYVSGHPLAEYRELVSRHATVTTDRLASCRDKETVRLCAIVVGVKEITTRNGERMAFVTLEDLAGTVEAIAFPDLYRASLLYLVKDAAVLVKGQVDLGEEETAKLVLMEVTPLSALVGNGASVVEIRVNESPLAAGRLEELKHLLQHFPGPARLRLLLNLADGAQVAIAASPEVTVAPQPSLKQEVEALLGPDTLTFM
jgi:DNA polymerase-3 subunit alpha